MLLHLVRVATHTLVVELRKDRQEGHPHTEDESQRRAEVIEETECPEQLYKGNDTRGEHHDEEGDNTLRVLEHTYDHIPTMHLA